MFSLFIFASLELLKMIVGGHGDLNPNTSWLNSKGVWLSYTIGVLMLHLVLLCIPILTTAVAWTLTNVIHNLVYKIFQFMWLAQSDMCILLFCSVC